LPVAGIGMKFMDAAKRAECLDRISGRLTLAEIPQCAGEQYPRVVLGENDLAVFERILPWDHVPGALFVEEAGGKTARPDGSPYRFWDGKPGLLTAASPAMWDRVAAILYK
jgi:fructose-1,6-bisphosphatase/inositol monophosphatase family enzyme